MSKEAQMSASLATDYIYGRNPIIEYLKSDRTPDKIFVNKELIDGTLRLILSRAKEKKVVVSYCTREKLNELTGTTKHQGVAALIAPIAYVSVRDILERSAKTKTAPLIFILDSIEDPHNLGAIIRTAEVCGASGVIIPNRRSALVNSTVMKASAGAAGLVPIARVANLANAIGELKAAGFWIFGAEADGERFYYEQDMTGSVALIIGSESGGIRPVLKKSCDFTVKIPVMGAVNSLNASVAAGILAFEVIRQRSK